MAECNETDDDGVAKLTESYKPPAPKSLEEIANQDPEDESLRRYKEALLGPGAGKFASSGIGKKVVVKQLSVLVEGRPDINLDLTGDMKKLKNDPVVLKEGVEYRLRLTFNCPGEIVSGLRFDTTFSKVGFKERTTSMVGSFGPKEEDHVHTLKPEVAPTGMVYRGKYDATSVFIDDDKTKHLECQWAIKISKHWPEEKEAKK